MQGMFACKDTSFFAGMPGAHSMVQSALAGYGRILADSPLHPRCAVAVCGDFVYCGGEPGASAAHLLRQAMGGRKGLLVYAPGRWLEVLKRLTDVNMVTRSAFCHHIQPEDGHLHRLLDKRPEGMSFQPIEGTWISWCRQAEWSRDFVSLFTDEQFAREGLGVLLMQEGVPVAGASSYVRYPGGIEIQVQTRDDCQGRGYATLAAAKVILMAHACGLNATWDAANEVSAHIAQKLGYRCAGMYQVAETC